MKLSKKDYKSQKPKSLRKSASIILLYPYKTKQNKQYYKTLILKRKSTMSFNNSYVFPGGACSPEDQIQCQSKEFTVYSKMTAIRQFLQESGLLIYPKQSQKYVCTTQFMKKSIQQMSNQLGKIWNNSLGYIQPVLRLMTPQIQKGKRFDCIFFICKAGDRIKVANVQHIKTKINKQQKFSYQQSDLNQSELLYDKGQSDAHLFEQPFTIYQQFKQGKINMIPPQIILFNWLIILCRKQEGNFQVLGRLCEDPQKNYFSQVQPIMFKFDIKNRKMYILGDSQYNTNQLLSEQPPSQSKQQLQNYFDRKIKEGYIRKQGIRRLNIDQKVIFISNYNEVNSQSCLKYLHQQPNDNNKLTKSVVKPKL